MHVPDLPRALRGLLRQIPAGRVATCGAVARALGSRYAARWVGQTAWENTAAGDDVPWHRVVRIDGGLGALEAGIERVKARRLRQEGVAIEKGRAVLERHQFDAFRSRRPLHRLAETQRGIERHISLEAKGPIPRLVGGVDVGYPDPQHGRAAYAMVHADSGELIYRHVIRRRVRMPYITTFLSFRELPLLLRLLEEVGQAQKLAPVILVDGSGVLHPRHAGIASHLGVLAGHPTVGVTKKLLGGQVDIEGMAPGESRAVLDEGRPLGAAIRVTSGSRRPIFVSPGHRVDVAGAEQVVRAVLAGHRLPEPLYWADRLARE
ncbi:MAG: endonuclease V [Pirellulales bacterium]